MAGSLRTSVRAAAAALVAAAGLVAAAPPAAAAPALTVAPSTGLVDEEDDDERAPDADVADVVLVG